MPRSIQRRYVYIETLFWRWVVGMALPASGDAGLLLAADAVSNGYSIAETGLFYRKWPGQVTNQPPHTDAVEWPARMGIIEARAEYLAEMWEQRGDV